MARKTFEQAVLAHVAEDLAWIRSAGGAACESPIEREFLQAFIAYSRYVAGNTLIGFRTGKDALRGTEIIDPPGTFEGAFVEETAYAAQVPIGKFRADFVVNASRTVYEFADSDEPFTRYTCFPSIVVECDGHEYHERTADQALRDRSRDRAMSQMGYRVMRFTGREIHADAFACARQVYDLIESMSSHYTTRVTMARLATREADQQSQTLDHPPANHTDAE